MTISMWVIHFVLNYSIPEKARPFMASNTKLKTIAWQIKLSVFQPYHEGSIYHLSTFHWHMRDSFIEKLNYVVRTITTPRPTHFISLQLPNALFWGYIPFKMIHDYFLLPLWIAFKKIRKQWNKYA
jgi:hypothetical protein